MPLLRDMGKWNYDHYKKLDYCRESYYKNTDAVEKVIRYITRTRWNESRQNELISYGGAGIDINASVEIIIQQFLAVQNFNNINSRGGRRLIHEVYSFSQEEFRQLNNDYRLINLIARNISTYYYSQQ